MKQSQKTLLLWVLLILTFVFIWQFVGSENTRTETKNFSEFMALVRASPEEKHVESVEIKDREYTFVVNDPVTKQKPTFKTLGPVSDVVTKDLIDHNVTVRFQKEEGNSIWMTALVTILPMGFLLLMFYFFMRQLQAGGGKAMSFGKSRAKLLNESQNKITFADVAGIEEAKDEVEEIIAFLKDPKKFQRLGGRIPKGVLTVGPPGTGKTLLARAIAGEAGVPFFSISGSDFVEMFVGVGASRVRDLFEQGKRNAPCIIFIDEIDAVGRHRGAGLGGGHDEREQTLNQLLVEMDGFESSEGVIIIAATNRPDVLDPAILRPGRFDRRITVPRPDVRGRTQILHVHTRKTPLSPDVELETIARGTPGFAGADLENLVNEAALLAARFDRDQVTMSDFEMAKDKVLMGTERRSMVISEHEKRTTACHEAGHALVAIALAPNADPVHKVTIIPRGPALGVTQQLPKEDRLSISRDYCIARLAVLMGGRVAEQIVYGQMTTGAGNDIKQASSLARRMVTEFGMSEELGPITYGSDEEGNPFLGRDFGSNRRDYSEKMAERIDEEVRQIILGAEKSAREILTTKRDVLDKITETLLERETIDAEEIAAIVEDRPLPKREKLIMPTWADKEKASKEKRRNASIFGPPKPVTGLSRMAAPAALRRLGAAFSFSLLGALTSLFAISTIATDPEPVSPSGLVSVRKETGPLSFVEETPAPLLATLVNIHTGESTILSRDEPSHERWSSLLEDRVTGAHITIEPQLLDVLRQLARKYPGEKIELVSGYRSPKLNEMLRKKGHRVASHSQHSLGHAVDFRLGRLTPKQMRAEVEKLGWKGGVGQYDKPTDRFIHVDVGKNRRWHER